MPLIAPFIFNNPCIDEAIVGTTKQGQIVYMYDRMVDAYADELLRDYNTKEREKEIRKQVNKTFKGTGNKEKDNKEKEKIISKKINEDFSDNFMKCYMNAMNYLDVHTIFPLNSSGNEVYFDDIDFENSDFFNHGYGFFDEENENYNGGYTYDENGKKRIEPVKPLIIYGI